MDSSSNQHAAETVDLSKYAKRILDERDYPLFDDAVQSAKAGVLRAAYVMIWLACAESLKRRFQEAQTRDSEAAKIVRKIEDAEGKHRAVDKLLLEKAHEYGFISASGYAALDHIYEMRCLYAHPYEEAPSQEKVVEAAASVVELVLSQPVRLRHGFGKRLLSDLLEERNYLDDYELTVTTFTKGILPRIDENVYAWLLDRYWEEMEKLADDPSVAIFFRRGIWFSCAALVETGASIFSGKEWHERVSKFPKTLMSVCCTPEIFEGIGDHAQDSLVGSIIDESRTRASVLANLEILEDEGALSERQHARFAECVAGLRINTVRASGLTTKLHTRN